MLIVVLFDFLNIKSVKIYAIPYILSTTLLLYKLDTLLLKQKNLPVLDITGFFFHIRTQGPHNINIKRNKGIPHDFVRFTHLGLHLSTHAEKETRYIQYGPLLLLQ